MIGCVGFLKPPCPENEWQIRMQGAFTMRFDMPGIRHTDQSCHHEVRGPPPPRNVRLVDRISRDDNFRRPNSGKEEFTLRPQQRKEASIGDHVCPRDVSTV